MQRKPQSNFKDNRIYEYIREDKDKKCNNRFEALSDDEERDEDSDLTLSHNDMR